MPVTICTCTYQISTVCRIRRGRPRDLCAETSGHGFFRHESPTDQRTAQGKIWECHNSLSATSCAIWRKWAVGNKFREYRYVGVNLHGLHGYESPDLLENNAEVGSCMHANKFSNYLLESTFRVFTDEPNNPLTCDVWYCRASVGS